MAFTTLISTAELAEHLDDPNWAIIDCRFALSDTEKGRMAYLESHIPGALYAHLDEDLSGPIIPGETGRHPLPDVSAFAQTLSVWGIDAETQVVAYDDLGGFMAGRLWWMLGWLGHTKVAVLDGDWRHWVNEGRQTRSGAEARTKRTFVPQERPELVVDADEVLNNLENDEFVLVDARDESRFRGEGPPGIDPVNGHIPGAISGYLGHNLDQSGKLRSAAELQAYYIDLLGDPDTDIVPDDVVFYCGSGVTAAHDLLAMQVAGLGEHRLYPGSWSDWILDPERPLATGDAS